MGRQLWANFWGLLHFPFAMTLTQVAHWTVMIIVERNAAPPKVLESRNKFIRDSSPPRVKSNPWSLPQRNTKASIIAAKQL